MPHSRRSGTKQKSHFSASTSRFQTRNIATPVDEDIQLGVQTLSFSCPLSLMRISNPGKGKYCKHKQCFDLKIFLQFFERKPLSKWKCTVCNMPVTADTLVTDYKFKGYLLKFPNEDRCVIYPDGTSSSVESFKKSTERGTIKSEPSRQNPVSFDLITDSEDEVEDERPKHRIRKGEKFQGLPDKSCVTCKNRAPKSDTNLCDLCTKTSHTSSKRPTESPSHRTTRQRSKLGRFCRETNLLQEASPPSRSYKRPPLPSPRSSHRRRDSSSSPSRGLTSSRCRARKLFDVSLTRPDVIVID